MATSSGENDFEMEDRDIPVDEDFRRTKRLREKEENDFEMEDMDIPEDEELRRIKRRRVNEEISKPGDSSCSYGQPSEAILGKIFSYLSYGDLCRAGRVCRTWHSESRKPKFWRRVDTRGLGLSYETVHKFLRCVPSCVTHLRIRMHFYDTSFPPGRKDQPTFRETPVRLREMFPRLQVLLFENAQLNDFMDKDDPNFCSIAYLPPDLRVLSFAHSNFSASTRVSAISPPSFPKLQVIHVFNSHGTIGRRVLNMTFKLTDLKELRFSKNCDFFNSEDDIRCLFDANKSLKILQLQLNFGATFPAIQRFGRSLVELYVCSSSIHHWDRILHDVTFSHLEIICFRKSDVDFGLIIELLRSCRSLKRMYVCNITRTVHMFSDWHFFLSEISSGRVRCDFEIEDCNHHRETDFMNA